MAELVLKAENRTVKSGSLRTLRKEGAVPGVVYGQGKPATLVKVSAKLLDHIYQEAGNNKLVRLELAESAANNVIFHEVQINPLTQNINHFDLYTVKMDEEIKAEIPIRFINESGAAMTESAVLLKNLETIEVESLPGDLPESFEVDLSRLATIGDSVTVGDLRVPGGVKILTEPETLIVKADPPRSDEELEELDEAVEEGAEAEVEAEHGASEEAAGGDEGGDETKAEAKDEKDGPEKP